MKNKNNKANAITGNRIFIKRVMQQASSIPPQPSNVKIPRVIRKNVIIVINVLL
jgi:hypothetical protein